MDWRDNLEADKRDSDRGEGGYVVTGGMDNTIKVWDFALPTLSSKPVRILSTSQPVQAVSWHPTRATELISSPLPSLSLNVPASTPTEEGGPNEGMMDGGLGSSWRNEIEVWDVRKEYYPKLCIKTNEPISGQFVFLYSVTIADRSGDDAAIIYNEDDTIWSTSKSSATFHQHDLNHDAYSTVDTYPRSAATWSVEGDLIFVEESRKPNDIPFDEHYSEFRPVDSPAYRPESSIAFVPSFDPDHEHAAFTSLANNYVLYGEDLAAVCDLNIEVSRCDNLYGSVTDAVSFRLQISSIGPTQLNCSHSSRSGSTTNLFTLRSSLLRPSPVPSLPLHSNPTSSSVHHETQQRLSKSSPLRRRLIESSVALQHQIHSLAIALSIILPWPFRLNYLPLRISRRSRMVATIGLDRRICVDRPKRTTSCRTIRRLPLRCQNRISHSVTRISLLPRSSPSRLLLFHPVRPPVSSPRPSQRSVEVAQEAPRIPRLTSHSLHPSSPHLPHSTPCPV